jgi:hypothetical protein
MFRSLVLTMEITACQPLGLIFMHPEDITSLEVNE